MFRRKGKLVKDEIDELPEPSNVPDYSKPKPPPMGAVDGDTAQTLGGIEPKVSFTQESLPGMPGNPDRPTIEPNPTADEIAAMKRYYLSLRADMMQQVAMIEDMLGFVDVCDDLAVRIAKLEKFVGIK